MMPAAEVEFTSGEAMADAGDACIRRGGRGIRSGFTRQIVERRLRFRRRDCSVSSMTWMVRCVVVALIGMMVTLAHQRGLDLVATDEDFIHVRDLPPEVAEATGFRSLGYHYKVFGMYGLDLWRWNGEFVIYQTTIDNPITRAELASGRIVLSSTSYARVDEIEGKDSVEGLESSVPWRYYC